MSEIKQAFLEKVARALAPDTWKTCKVELVSRNRSELYYRVRVGEYPPHYITVKVIEAHK